MRRQRTLEKPIMSLGKISITAQSVCVSFHLNLQAVCLFQHAGQTTNQNEAATRQGTIYTIVIVLVYWGSKWAKEKEKRKEEVNAISMLATWLQVALAFRSWTWALQVLPASVCRSLWRSGPPESIKTLSQTAEIFFPSWLRNKEG